MKKKILITYNFNRDIFKELENDFELIYPDKTLMSKEEVLSKITDCEVLITLFTYTIDKDMIEKGVNLKLISNMGAGYNNIDIEYATQKSIVVTNTPRAVLEPTAELAFGLISAVARNIGYDNIKLRSKEGAKWGLYEDMSLSIYGKTLGIFGMGRIGQAVARRAIAAGMNVIYNNRKRVSEAIEKLYNAKYVSFDELISQSDIISLHAPATKETSKMINKDVLSRMKPNAILVNTARGTLIDEEALIEALRAKRIFGAGLDVFDNEPNINKAFFELENVVITPHTGTKTVEARNDSQREILTNVLGFYNNEKIDRVN